MNLVVHGRPNLIGISDSCPWGGFLLTGFAWRLLIPAVAVFYGISAANNLLEFLAMTINIWLSIISGTRLDCILGVGDNRSGIGWIKRSGHLPLDSIYAAAVLILMIARKIATLVTEWDGCLASQHLKGQHNDVYDLLSYSGECRGHRHALAYDEPSDSELTHRSHSHLPQLIPSGFEFRPLPSKILSWVVSVLRTFESSWIRSKKPPTKREINTGDVGPVFLGTSAFISNSSVCYPRRTANSSPNPSWRPSAPLNLTSQGKWLASVREGWYRPLSKLPQAAWLRRCGVASSGVPSMSKGLKSFSLPLLASSGPTKT
jgi:hypothetical protein